MASKGDIEREKKVRSQIAKYSDIRQNLRNIIRDINKPVKERMEAKTQLSLLPRSGSYIRARNRCSKTHRPRGYYRFVGLCRHALRELAFAGLLPGIKKASW